MPYYASRSANWRQARSSPAAAILTRFKGILLIAVRPGNPAYIGGYDSLTLREQDFACRAGDGIMKGDLMPNLEEAIRERAYHLWIADGQPEGQADIYWLNAQREILTTSVESSGSNAAAARPPTQAWLRRNPLKRPKSPDRGKAKPAPHSSSTSIVTRIRIDDSAISGGSGRAPAVRQNETKWDRARF